MRNTLVVLVFTSLLTACGQMGPLYLPEPEVGDGATEQPASADAPQTEREN